MHKINHLLLQSFFSAHTDMLYLLLLFNKRCWFNSVVICHAAVCGGVGLHCMETKCYLHLTMHCCPVQNTTCTASKITVEWKQRLSDCHNQIPTLYVSQRYYRTMLLESMTLCRCWYHCVHSLYDYKATLLWYETLNLLRLFATPSRTALLFVHPLDFNPA